MLLGTIFGRFGGTPPEPGAEVPFGGLWSLMHLDFGGVAIPSVEETLDQPEYTMMMGLYDEWEYADGEDPDPDPDPELPTLAFFSDFRNGTGTGETALTDGGKWDNLDFASLLSVASPDLGDASWPDNMLVLDFNAGDGHLLAVEEAWAAPTEGNSIYFRFLMNMSLTGGQSTSGDHGQQSNIGTIRHSWAIDAINEGIPSLAYWKMGFNSSGRNGALEGQLYAILPRFTNLRFEWALHRTTGTNANVELRVYDESVSKTVPQWTNEDFVDEWGEGSNTWADYPLVNLGNLTDGFRSYMLGISGSGTSTASPIYVGGFAVSLEDWCGPYDSSNG